ncbi:MAG TPA: hypothetical protein V6D50_03675 [Chroococcales cyanobacterium]
MKIHAGELRVRSPLTWYTDVVRSQSLFLPVSASPHPHVYCQISLRQDCS